VALSEARQESVGARSRAISHCVIHPVQMRTSTSTSTWYICRCGRMHSRHTNKGFNLSFCDVCTCPHRLYFSCSFNTHALSRNVDSGTYCCAYFRFFLQAYQNWQQVLAKSCRPMPVMLMGKKYAL
jgi:NAD-dependent oxidoreductase involved in siderophore biosynthesis